MRGRSKHDKRDRKENGKETERGVREGNRPCKERETNRRKH